MNLFGVLLFIIGFLVLALQVYAFYNLNDKDFQSQATGISIHWLFKESIYNASGKKACQLARWLCLIAIPLLIAWFINRYY